MAPAPMFRPAIANSKLAVEIPASSTLEAIECPELCRRPLPIERIVPETTRTTRIGRPPVVDLADLPADDALAARCLAAGAHRLQSGANPLRPLMKPKVFGRYRVTGEVGRGAMGTVYRAVDPLLGREVAVKTLLPDLPPEAMDEVRERFLREARSAARMSHPNIVTIFDVGEQDGIAWIAMEILSGRPLDRILREERRPPFERIAEIAAQVADALDYAGELGIVHRDVKPSNIVLDHQGRAKLVDFGIAHMPASTMTQTGASLGSPRYMSPEQVLGLAVDPRADIFSLGVVLYEMLAGRTPFQRAGESNVFSLMNRIASEPHAPVRTVDPGIPQAFERILDRALAKKPEQRYARAGEMAADLRRLVSQLAVASPAPAAAPPPAGDAAPPGGAREAWLRDRLIDDLEAFARNFEAAQQAQLHAEQEERRRREEEVDRWAEAEARKRIEFERRLSGAALDPGPGAAAAPGAAVLPAEEGRASGRRAAALEMLRRKAAERPSAEQLARDKAAQHDALDRTLRNGFRYLAEFVKELNEVRPVAGRRYEYIYLGVLPPVTLSDAFVDVRPQRREGRDFCDHIVFRYRITLSEPARATVLGADIARLEQMLKAVQAQFEMKAEAKGDFGDVRRASFTVRATLPCRATLRGDYERGRIAVELVNVRRPGTQACTLEMAQFESAVDDFARYVLGADDDFARYFPR